MLPLVKNHGISMQRGHMMLLSGKYCGISMQRKQEML